MSLLVALPTWDAIALFLTGTITALGSLAETASITESAGADLTDRLLPFFTNDFSHRVRGKAGRDTHQHLIKIGKHRSSSPLPLIRQRVCNSAASH
jgi:hypothetical protein